jgi:tetratricopeptide (TPR) repeat protein
MATTSQELALARQYCQAGDFGRAERLCRQILRGQPAYTEALYLLGAVCHGLRRLDEALRYFDQVLRAEPHSAQAHYARGLVFQDQGNLEAAAGCLEEAVRLWPDWPQAHYQLGNLARLSGQAAWAADCYRRAVAVGPKFTPAHHALAMLYLEEEQRTAALECLQQVVRLQPTQATAHSNLGSFLLEEGRKEEAASHFQEALRHDPSCVPALAAVANLGLYALKDAELQRMLALAKDARLSSDERARLSFGLANIYDRAGAYDEAFRHFEKANTIRRREFQERGTALDVRRHREVIDRMIATCDAAYFQRVPRLGRDTDRPIFIVGMPRSGTTLVEQVLASHPGVYGAGELRDIQRMAENLPARLKAAEEYPACLARLDQATAGALADQYLAGIGRRSGTAPRVTDKLPTNFEHLGLIAALFPRARVIHCVRDPLDVCLSCYFQDFRSTNFAWDLDDLGKYHVEYERLMAHWRKALPLPMLEVVYEELVGDLEKAARRLVSFCGLDWDERCLAYHQNRRPVRTVSLLQVRQPVYQSSVGRWRHYQSHLQPLFKALGHSPEGPSCPAKTANNDPIARSPAAGAYSQGRDCDHGLQCGLVAERS